jgi:hypothetical protein
MTAVLDVMVVDRELFFISAVTLNHAVCFVSWHVIFLLMMLEKLKK